MAKLTNDDGYYSAITNNANIIAKNDPTLSKNKIFFLENKVMNNINDFNVKYSRYTRCNDNTKVRDAVNDPPCNDLIDTYSNLDDSYKSVISSINDLKGSIVGPAKTDPSKYDVSYNDIITKYEGVNGILKMRSDLDTKLQRLYDERNGGSESSIAQLEATRYAGMLWTILATIMLYFIFIG